MKARKISKLYNVYIEAGRVRYTMLEAVSLHEAETFCKENNWSFKDENDFVWDMNYEEI